MLNKKAALGAPLLKIQSRKNLRRFGGLFLGRAGVLALGVHIAVDEFDHRHRRIVAVTEASLDDTGIAALAVLVARGQRIEQLADLILIAHFADGLATQGE